jgi:hypothetical protein
MMKNRNCAQGFSLGLKAALLALLMTMAACGGGGDDEQTPLNPHPPTPEGEGGGATPPTLSLKATASGVAFANGDKIGAFMAYGALKSAGNYLHNLPMQTDGSSWTLERTVSWQDNSTPADFYAYAPFQASLSDPLACLFQVSTDQSTAEKQKACDLLWGKLASQSPTARALTITLRRLFAKLTVKVEAGEGVTPQDLNDSQLAVSINGLQVQATVNLSDGSITPSGATAVIVPLKEQERTYSAVIVPQHVEETALVTVNWNGEDYTLTQAMTFESGKQYSLTVTIKKTAGTVNVGISQWETTDEDFGGTVN